MRSNRVALEWDVDQLPGWIQQGTRQPDDYQHTEYEGAEAGTVFKNKGNDVRITARHAKLGAWQGVLGLQSEAVRFSADGAEAFALPTAAPCKTRCLPLKNCHGTGISAWARGWSLCWWTPKAIRWWHVLYRPAAASSPAAWPWVRWGIRPLDGN